RAGCCRRARRRLDIPSAKAGPHHLYVPAAPGSCPGVDRPSRTVGSAQVCAEKTSPPRRTAYLPLRAARDGNARARSRDRHSPSCETGRFALVADSSLITHLSFGRTERGKRSVAVFLLMRSVAFSSTVNLPGRLSAMTNTIGKPRAFSGTLFFSL